MISLVVARARNGAIGKDNQIPWHLPEDLRMFQRETLGSAVIMGRLTWESLPFKPLKNRMNIVVSRDAGLTEHVTGSVTDAIAMAQAAGYPRISGIGGESIFHEMLPICHRLLLTEVDLTIDDAQAFFPPFDESEWREISRRVLPGDGPAATLRELIRR
ncbi:dihydrofolate reductase [Paracoccus laeviglucosivorans]|uniref:Dihydrofolate reductase n=1 Tax=Paracoccus laeviglucosivorans TaxID=1197861 RepID=A0A521F6D1_9RHOB|nr:dihydrofolate reductase [Paracoccus laeviglucosivorans]SMO91181.1 dihydrofolate reductase [Paracoccus laeviglucosivorans]